jgi:biopolymer transport protein ExbB/TolQ
LRSAAAVHQDLKRGLNTLATITCLAPFLGILGTVLAGIPDSFPGFGTDKTHAMAIIFKGLSRALVPTALGLLAGLQSLCCYKYLSGRLAQFDGEMNNRSLQLLNELPTHLSRFELGPASGLISDSVPFLATYSAGVGGVRKPFLSILGIKGRCHVR